ncbi:hypothetical protein QZH41_013280, partial [Actinostola sp. cb2023]
MASGSSVLYHGIRNESDNDADNEGDALSESFERRSAGEDEKAKPDDEASGGTSSSSCHATWNLFNMVEGAGVLGLPYAVKEGGIVVLLGLAVLAIISNYTGQILISCLYDTEKQSDEKADGGTEEKTLKIRVRGTYEEVGRACFPRFGGKVVVVVQILELVFVSTLYLVLSGSLMSHTFPNSPISERGWIAIGALVVLPTVFLKQLSHVAWLSLFSIVALLTTVTAVTGFGIRVSERWDIHTIDRCNIETFPVGIGIVLFSYAAHPLLPGIEESMENKSKFPLIMNVTFLVAAVTKILFSTTAYLSFSEKTQEVITNNLPPVQNMALPFQFEPEYESDETQENDNNSPSSESENEIGENRIKLSVVHNIG